jgi:hypothetical protein
MTKVLLVLALASGSLFGSDPAVTDGMSNGKAWNGLGGGNAKTAVMLKFLYVTGLADGIKQGREELIPRLFPKPTAGQEEKVAELVPNLLPAKADFTDMIAGLDEFYDDSLNLEIPIPIAARYVKARLEKRPTKEVDESLKRLRTLYNMKKQVESMYQK